MTFLQRIADRWLFEEYEYDFRSLGVYRMLFAGYLLLVALPGGLWIPEAPPASFSPPLSLMAFFTSYPPAWVIYGANAVAMLFGALLLVGLKTPLASLGTGLSFIVVRSFCYADGKIDHEILLGLAPLILACSGWGNALSMDEQLGRPVFLAPRTGRPWLLAIFALVIGLCLFSAGLAKARGGWFSFHTHATVWHLLPNYYLVGREQPLAKWALGHFPGPLWEAMDWTTTIWESTVVLLAIRRRAFVAACGVGCLFHLGVWLLFHIAFGQNIIAYAAFVPWHRVLRVADAPAPFAGRRGQIALAVALVSGAVALFGLKDTIDSAFSLHLGTLTVVVGAIAALSYFGRLAASLSPRTVGRQA